MSSGQAGKGDAYRPVDQAKFAKGYLRVFGVQCRTCSGLGYMHGHTCPGCKGEGRVEKKRK